MKTYKLVFLFQVMLFISCIQSDEFGIPELEIQEVNIDPNSLITISALRNLLVQEINNNGNQVLSFDDQNPESDKYISGYVVSNDEAGNFFKELIIQNDTINPDAGVKILVDVNPLFTTFDFGRRLYIRLDGLTVGIDSGVLTLGMRDRNIVANIASSQLFDFVLRDSKVAKITPMELAVSDFADGLTNLYIAINDVQFHRYEVVGDNPKTFAAEPTDQYAGERIVESCIDKSQIVLSTSTFADFKALQLPSERGSIKGILMYNFFGDKMNVVINSPMDIKFDNPDRCDPVEINCGIAIEEGNILVLSEFFESQQPGTPINEIGWTNYIEAGSQNWEAYFEEGANASLGISARIGSYNSGDVNSVSWLITPHLDFQLNEGETLQFKTSNSFSDGSKLELLYSEDWNGDPEEISNATWSLLSAAYIVHDDDHFGDWFSSGIVDLSCISGNGHIAWKYVGRGNADFDGTYELDNIEFHTN